MGLELVMKVQALRFQGGNTPSTLVPRVVPNIQTYFSNAIANAAAAKKALANDIH